MFVCGVVAFQNGFSFYQKKGIWCFLTFISQKKEEREGEKMCMHNMQTEFNNFNVTTADVQKMKKSERTREWVEKIVYKKL